MTLYILAVLIALVSCSTYKNTETKRYTAPTAAVNDTVRIANDSLAYEILIFEPGFNAWLATQPPRGFYAQATMEQLNYLKVTNYNLRVQNPIAQDPHLYTLRIDYDRNTNYGYEVNYMLYHYFLFFEERYTQRLR